jgi:hypothetical protein
MVALGAGLCSLKLLKVMSQVLYLLRLHMSLLLHRTSFTLPRLQSVPYPFLFHGSYHGIPERMQTIRRSHRVRGHDKGNTHFFPYFFSSCIPYFFICFRSLFPTFFPLSFSLCFLFFYILDVLQKMEKTRLNFCSVPLAHCCPEFCFGWLREMV